jgi:DNA-binding transcriptional MocR family regulator
MSDEPIEVTVDQRFVIVPRWVVLAPVSPTAIRLYCVLMTYADSKERTCWPSLNTLAAAMHASKTTVVNAVAELERLGALDVKRGKSDQGRNLPSVYHLRTYPQGYESVPGDGYAKRPRGVRSGTRTRTNELDESQSQSPGDNAGFSATHAPGEYVPEPTNPEAMGNAAAAARILRASLKEHPRHDT